MKKSTKKKPDVTRETAKVSRSDSSRINGARGGRPTSGADHEPDFAPNLLAASQRWGIPRQVLKWARGHNCPAFHGARVHKIIVEWIKKNPPPEDLEEFGESKDELDAEIKKRKIKKLDLEIGEAEKSLVQVESVKFTWAQAMEKIMSLTQAFLPKEEFNAWARQLKSSLKGMDL